MRSNWHRWPLWSPLALLPFVGAWQANTDSLTGKLGATVGDNLKAAGAEWAQVAFDGRDAKIAGAAPSDEAIQAAAKAVAGSYGVRRVDIAGTSLAELAAPGFSDVATNKNPPELKGTWGEGVAKTLSVSVGDKTFKLGENPELTSDGKGGWTLKYPSALGDGDYPIAIETSDGAKRTAKLAAPGKLSIDTVAPPKPTIRTYAGASLPKALTGSWAEGDATSLKVTIGENAYELGKTPELKSDKGNWELTPPADLGEGAFDIGVETADAAGNVASAAAPGGLFIDSKPPAAPSFGPIADKKPIKTLTGTMDGGDAETLSVAVNGATYILRVFTGLQRIGKDKWRLELPAALSDGTHTIKVETADRAGNISSVTGTVTIDAKPPEAPSIASLAIGAPGTTLSGTLDPADTDIVAVTVDGSRYVERVFTGMQRAGRDGWRLVLASPLADGEHEVTVETIDKAGNSSSASAKVTVDATPPAAPTIDQQVARERLAALTGTLDGKDTDRLTVTVDGRTYGYGVFTGLQRVGGDRWKLTLPARLSEGTHDIAVMTADKMGNKAEAKGALLVDATPPKPPRVDKLVSAEPVTKITGTMDGQDAQTLDVTVGGSTYGYRTYTGLQRVGRDRWTLSLPQALGEGSHDVSVMTEDAAGNSSRTNEEAVIVVATPPRVPTVNRISGNNRQPEITGTWDRARSSALSVTLAGKTYALGGDASLASDDAGNWKLVPPEPLKDGIYDVVAMATGKSGAEAKDETVAEVEIDTTGPSAPTVDAYYGKDASVAVTGTWPEDSGNTLSVELNGLVYRLGDAPQLTSADGKWSLKPGKPLADGIYDVIAIAADGFGNPTGDRSSAEIQIDTTGPAAPTVNPATALPVSGAWPEGKARSLSVTLAGKTYVLGTDAQLTSDGAGAWTLAPSDALAPGTYDVVASAADALGNATADETKDELVIAEPAPPPPPPAEMKAPTVNALSADVARPKITGTWDEGVATMLAVSVGGTDYKLGTDEALTSASGVWTLAVPRPLKDGVYDVIALSSDAAGKSLNDATTNELTVDALGPATPTVDLYAGEASPETVSGSWAEGDATSLTVAPSWTGGKAYQLGTDQALVSNGNGRWILTVESPLEPGSYDIAVTTSDAKGRTSSDQTRFEILVKETKKAEPVPQPPPPSADCGPEISQLLLVKPFNFETDKSALRGDDLETVNQIAGLMQSCPDKSFEVGGHTDYVGSWPYNQALSERRAISVMKALVAANIDAKRLTTKGYGEDVPLASNESAEGRAVNRRIEIKIVK